MVFSEAYIKYIEGLSRETKTMCNWDKQLTASNEVEFKNYTHALNPWTAQGEYNSLIYGHF